MSNQIPAAFVQQFSDNVIILAQQKGSKLRESVMNKTVVGDAAYFERIGPTTAQIRSTRHGQSPQVDTPHSRRRVALDDYEWGDMIDKQDEIRMLIDPKSAYALNAGYALGRAMDDVIINAAAGSAVSVTSSLAGTTTSVTLPTTNIISQDFGTANSNLTIAKLIEARRLLMKYQQDDEQLTLVLNASAMAALLNTTQVTSSDYNSVKALVRGEIDSFMGFTFVYTERLQGVADGTNANPIKVLAYAKSGIGLAVGQDVTTRIAERADRSFSTYVYASMTIGAVRIEEEKVFVILCVQTA